MQNNIIIDLPSLLENLEKLSLFDLNRIQLALYNMTKDPERLAEVRRKVRVGMLITYFCPDTNNFFKAHVTEVLRNNARVTNVHDGQGWLIHLCYIQLDSHDTSGTARNTKSLDRNSLKVGDRVGWNSKLGRELYGVVQKLNPKMVVVKLQDGQIWRVAYSLLFPVLDCDVTDKVQPLYIDHQ